jgi:Holliday junction resolvase
MQRNKGAAAERELFGLLSDLLGFVVRRNVDQARRGGADGIEIPGWAIECKRQEQWESRWWDQARQQADIAGRMPALCYRASRQPWRVRVLLEDVVYTLRSNDFIAGHAWVEMDLPTFAMIVRESLPEKREAAPA